MNSFILILLFLFLQTNLLVTVEVSKTSDINSEADSQNEKKKTPLDGEPETIEDSTFRKKSKKHSLTPDQIKKKKEIIEKMIKYGSNKERKEAMRELTSLPSEGMEEMIKLISETLVAETDNGIKISCLRTLAELEAKTEAKVIIPLLKDKSDDVKEAAIGAIQRLKLNEAASDLSDLLKTQDFTKPLTLTNTAIHTLADLETGKIASDFLENKLKEKNNSIDVRSSIALYFGKVKDLKAESSLLEVALDESEDFNLRAYAINSLGKMNSPRATAELKTILVKINDSKNKSEIKKYSILKLYIISALIMLGDKEILKDLIVYAKDDDASVRLRAIKQLGEIPDSSVIDLIEYKATRDPNKKVQDVAKKILEDWKQKGVIKTAVVSNKVEAKDTKEVKEKKDQDEWMINKGSAIKKVFPR